MKKLILLSFFFWGCLHWTAAQCDFTVDVVTTAATCEFDNGSISVTANGGASPYTFDTGFISGSAANSFTFVGLSTGTYQITVTDADACVEILAVAVDQISGPLITISGDQDLCSSGGTTCIDAVVFGGTPPYIFEWSDGSVNTSLCTSQPGIYVLTVTDANDCLSQFWVDIWEGWIPISISGAGDICGGNSTTLDAGAGFGTYLWSDGSTGQLLEVNTPGFYHVTVTDGGACTGTDTIAVQQGMASTMITGQVIFCTGTSSTLDAGAGFTNYLWSTNETSQTIDVTASGEYFVTVTDADACIGVASITVAELVELQPAISGVLTFCSGGSTLLDAGGNFETYLWSTGVTSSSIEVNTPGAYSVTVSDGDGCTGTATVDVSESPEPVFSIFGSLAFCAGESTVLSVDVSFASYQWTNGSNQPTITVSAPGVYEVTVTDANGCTGLSTVEVLQYAPPVVQITGDLELCANSSTILDAGPGFVNYQWSTGANTQTIIVDQPGVYTVSVVDANGCFGVAESFVSSFNFDVEVSIGLPASCGEPGTATAALVGGGTPPLTYAWSNGTFGVSTMLIEPGDYSLTVTDSYGCEAVENFFFPGATDISATVIASDVICFGNNDGMITIVDVQGVPPFSYSWSDGSTDEDRSGLPPGLYGLTITDSGTNNCPFISEYAILETDAMSLVLIASTPTSCTNTSDGNLDIEVSGGTPGYTFNWNDGSTTEDLWSASPGTYFVTVTDANGCEIVGGPYIVDSPAPIDVSFSVTPNGCNTIGTGAIDVNVTGGTGNYSFEWVGPNGFFSTTQNITGVVDGLYTFIVVDDNGCFDSLEVAIELVSPLELIISGSAQSCDTQGSAMVEATGGSGFYTYLWSNGANTQSIDNLSGGAYFVTVTDDIGCEEVTSIAIDSPIDLLVSSTQVDCDGNNGTATAIVGGATDPSFAWSNGAVGPMQTDLAPGFYSVTVTDAATNCATHENVEVEQDELCAVYISGKVFVELDTDCQEDNTTLAAGNIMVQLSDGQITFTNANGYYEFVSDMTDVYAITVNFSGTIFDPLCADPITVNALTFGEHYANNDFYLEYDEGANRDLNVKVSKPNARPGFTQKVRICLMNVGAVPVTGVLTYVHPEAQEFTEASPEESNYDLATRTVTWNFENIPPNAIWVYNAYMYTPTTVPLGTPLEYYFKAEPIIGDLTPANNELTCTMEVTGSYDPNDKQVDPIGIGEEGIISMTDTLLSYHVRFQNTGTDTAFTVVIRDQLDEDLDVSSVVPGPASHEYTLDILDGNILEFTFDNIMLPDSNINEPESHGFVFFDVKTKPNLEYGTKIENTAAIFFDFNLPIITNTVSNLIQMIVNTERPEQLPISMQLLPNPLSDLGQLKFVLVEQSEIQVDLLDMNGRHLKNFARGMNLPGGEHQLSVDLAALPNGVYYVRLITASGDSGLLKVVKVE